MSDVHFVGTMVRKEVGTALERGVDLTVIIHRSADVNEEEFMIIKPTPSIQLVLEHPM